MRHDALAHNTRAQLKQDFQAQEGRLKAGTYPIGRYWLK